MVGAAAAAAALAAAAPARADLRIHAEGGGAAPLDVLLRDVGPGFAGGLAIDYEVVPLLSVGGFYNFGYFAREPVDSAGTAEPPESCGGCSCVRRVTTDPVFDHAAGVRLGLRFVRHRLAGWFGADSGNLYGEAFFDLDLAYHNIGNEHRIGWGFGLGYRVLVAGPFGLGPVFRFRHIVAGEAKDASGEPVHQLYVSFGLTIFFTIDVTGEGTSRAGDQSGAGGEDEWDEFESAPGDDDE